MNKLSILPMFVGGQHMHHPIQTSLTAESPAEGRWYQILYCGQTLNQLPAEAVLIICYLIKTMYYILFCFIMQTLGFGFGLTY